MITFLVRDVGSLLQLPKELAALSLTCKQHKTALQFMLDVLRHNVWCSSNVRLNHDRSDGCSSSEVWQAWCPAGIPMKNTNFEIKAHLQMYETSSEELVLQHKDLQFSAFHEGEHYEPFNKLHGYYTLSEAHIPGRYVKKAPAKIEKNFALSATLPPLLLVTTLDVDTLTLVMVFWRGGVKNLIGA